MRTGAGRRIEFARYRHAADLFAHRAMGHALFQEFLHQPRRGNVAAVGRFDLDDQGIRAIGWKHHAAHVFAHHRPHDAHR
ncbi:hypothetical protein G6F46_015642 [Rhizopus delemar]|nr:hypothetical protein G6F46_015642 [Rhizopus delemar]